MFRTVGHTIDLMRMSWGILRADRALVAFPLLMFLSMGLLALAFGSAAAATGAFERLDSGSGRDVAGAMTLGDAALYVGFYVSAYFVGIFFNAALFACALQRLRGGNASVQSGIDVAMSRLPAIAGWTLIAATVGLILQAIRDRSDGALGRIVVSIAGGVWAYVTFFVVPVLVAEGVGPVAAIRRSGALFRQNWGRQVAAEFGFGLVYVLAILAAAVVAVLGSAVHPAVGVALGAVSFAVAICTVAALEGIFRAALYDFAVGGEPAGFERGTLANAYRAL